MSVITWEDRRRSARRMEMDRLAGQILRLRNQSDPPLDKILALYRERENLRAMLHCIDPLTLLALYRFIAWFLV